MKGLKHYQINKEYDRALNEYKSRYIESIKEGDTYISQLYLDELIQTILEWDKYREKNSRESLEYLVRNILQDEIEENKLKEFDNDLEICLAKRFPLKIKENLY